MSGGVVLVVVALADPLQQPPSQIMLETVAMMLQSLNSGSGVYFDHIIPCTAPSTDLSLSHYLMNNGVTNMLLPLFRAAQKGLPQAEPARVLRALYSFETYQLGRRILRSLESSAVVEALLPRLDKASVDVGAPFTPDPTPEALVEAYMAAPRDYSARASTSAEIKAWRERLADFGYLAYLLPVVQQVAATGRIERSQLPKCGTEAEGQAALLAALGFRDRWTSLSLATCCRPCSTTRRPRAATRTRAP
jgi:hypothetical protein